MDTLDSRRFWQRLGLLAVVLLAATLRLWRLEQNGYGNDYYSAGVRSMATSWHNFFYNSFDPAGFVSVDKPPLALWIQVASVKLFGFHRLSVLLPQVLEGLAAVLLIHHLVRRRFGAVAGLLAALFLAVTPVSVAVDRSSNLDSCLVLVLLLAAWGLTRAAEEGSRRFLLLSMAVVGLGFNVKMLAALVVLPTFVLVYLLGTPVPWRRRIADLALSAVVLAVVSLSWVASYDLTPPEQRPYAGTTDRNSMLELVVGPYGMGRFVRSGQFRSGPIIPVPGVTSAAPADAGAEGPAEPRPRRRPGRLFVRAPVGPLRLADGQLAGQTGWLLPFAVMGLVLGALHERARLPLAPRHLALLLWFGWIFTYGVVYSSAGGFFHVYYLSTMAPPLAALAGIGVVSLWSFSREKHWRSVLLPLTLLLTAAWQLYIDASALGWKLSEIRNLHLALVGGVLTAVAVWLVIPLLGGWSRSRALAGGAVTVGLAAVLVVPAAWALSSVLVAGSGVIPSADLARLVSVNGDTFAQTRLGKPLNTSRLIAFLRANHAGERYLLATSSTQLAAPIIIRTGQAVMAMGGYLGLDPILTPERLARMVEAHEIRFVMVGDLPLTSRRLGAEAAARPISHWVEVNGRRVDGALWRAGGFNDERTGMRLYDLRPDAALVPAPAE